MVNEKNILLKILMVFSFSVALHAGSGASIPADDIFGKEYDDETIAYIPSSRDVTVAINTGNCTEVWNSKFSPMYGQFVDSPKSIEAGDKTGAFFVWTAVAQLVRDNSNDAEVKVATQTIIDDCSLRLALKDSSE